MLNQLILCSLIVSAAAYVVPAETAKDSAASPKGQKRMLSELERRLPFLKGVDQEGRQEFFAIIHNETLSKAEIWEAVELWASKQDKPTKEAVAEFHKNLENHVKNSRLRVEKIVQNLPEALQKLSEIIEAVDISRTEEKSKIESLYASLDADTTKTLQFLVDLVSFRKNEGRSGGAERKALKMESKTESSTKIL
ncbi:unnamed protein product [Caenorhabditis auriculariae]|uniref:SXP/RAL-2 family protein Ani s 5-like cation-binding domain-containing protein n=1 Tax=Caenorhabditis auriculariae TaxID=2777116 RepID=A0A8S1HKS5_9PELO|nr:unnamed protein product [Caenorhabditis auriculariae]